MNKEYTGVDVFKIGAAFGVVAIHTDMPFFEIIGRLSVPFFAIISSFFFFKHYSSLRNNDDKRLYFFKFEKRMGLLILAWQIIYLPLTVEYFKRLVFNEKISVIKYVYYFIYPGYTNANGWGQSWYLIAMLLGIPIFIGLYKCCHIWGVTIISIILEIYYILANEFGFLLHLPVWGTLYFPRLLIYIFIGYIFTKKFSIISKFRGKRILIGLVVMLFLFLLENYFVSLNGGLINSEEIFTTVPTSIMLAMYSLRYSPKLKISALKIRNCSTFIYCVQNYPLQLFIKEFSNFLMSSTFAHIIFFTFVSLICLALFVIYSALLKKYKFLNYLV